MYKTFYGLTAKPFHITPDLDFLFLSHNHQKAITCMEFGIIEDTGIILLTGDIGTGKTTLIRHILTKIENDIRAATIYNTNVNSRQLLGLIMEAFGISNPADTKAQVIKRIQSGLEEIYANGQKPIIIIDDAQNLSLKTLEEIRLLSNLQSHDRMLVQIILVGQTELKEKLEDPSAAALAQRIGITYHISPFNLEETKAYIAHRLKIAGGSPDIFETDALDMIFQITSGTPRRINLICDHALVYGFADNIKTINKDIIREVLEDNPGLIGPDSTETILADGTKVADADKTGASTKIRPKSYHQKTSGNWRQHIEERIETLEYLMAEYNRELRDVIKTMFENERQKNDNLMLKNAQLQSESEMLKQKITRMQYRQTNPTPLKKKFRQDFPGTS